MIARRRLLTWSTAVLLLAPMVTGGGEWHRANGLRCSDCHTMHNSKGGSPMRYDGQKAPAPHLLRDASEVSLCLACHNGSDTHAPKVTTPTNGDPLGGGFPADLSDPNHTGHALGGGPVVPPDGDTEVTMTCSTCHSVHGNTRYRNLVESPSGTGRAAGIPLIVNQGTTANGWNPGDVYVQSNVVYKRGFSAWCMDCHNLATGPHTDSSLYGSPYVDYAHWSSDLTDRVRVQSPTDDVSPSQDDQAFCLTCHRAHGTPNTNALIWADGLTLDSTCQQCHFK